MSVFTLDNFGVTIGSVRLVDGVSLSIGAGKCVALVGASGSGKSLTAMTPFGLSPGTSHGSARMGMQELVGADATSLQRARGHDVGFVWQQPLTALTPHRTVGAALAEAAQQAGAPRPSRADLSAMLDRVGLSRPAERLAQYPHRLSGGERQRVLIAAAIAHRPKLLVADEPTTALDAVLRGDIMALLDLLRREDGMAMLLISHDLASVARHADRVVVMDAGQVVENGPAAAVLHAPVARYTQALLAPAPRLFAPADGAASAAGSTPRRAVDVPPLMTVTNAKVRYPLPGWRSGSLLALDVDTLSLAPGDALAIVGGSGSGKSTLGRAIAGLGPLDSGEIRWRGALLPARSARTRQHRRLIQPVFQDPVASLDRRWTVADSIAEPLRHLRPDVPAAEYADRIVNALHDVELPADFAARRPSTLSGGQAQRVAIARALIADPQLLLLDEATSALDVLVAASIIRLLKRLRDERGLSVLWITHDIAAAAQLCNRIAVMDAGQIVETGATNDIVAAPRHGVTRRLIAASH